MKHFFTKFILGSLMVLGIINANAQNATNYSFTHTATGSFISTVGGTTAVAAGVDDGASVVYNIGFPFWFQGTWYSAFSVSSNGGLRLGTTAISTTTYGTSFPVASQQILAPYLGDFATHSSGLVRVIVAGSTPNRILIAEWNNMRINWGSSTADATYQARLYEATGVIEYVYGAMAVGTGGTTTSGGGQTVKIGFSNSNTANSVFTVDQSTYAIDKTSATGLSNTNSAAGTITSLNGTSDGSRHIFTFTPNYTFAIFTSGNATWTAPASCVSTVTVEMWGGGGGGGNSNNTTNNGGTGGGGGAYAKGNHTVTGGSSYYYSVGTGGAGGPASSTTLATAGTQSWFNATAATNSAPASNVLGTLSVGGGAGVNNSTSSPANGGAAASSFGNVSTVSGSTGAAGTANGGGNGGSSTGAGASAGATTSPNNGAAGNIPGGGGGGSDDLAASSGGAGGIGRVVISYPTVNTSTPTVQPTSLLLTPGVTTIAGSFTISSPASLYYLVIRTTTASAPTDPVDGVDYTAGTTALGGYIESSSAATSWTSTSLSSGVQYWYWVYSYNGCTGNTKYLVVSPLTGTTTTVSPTNYYSMSSGDLDQITSWGINPDGSGTNPPNFTADGGIYNIRNNATPTIGAAWAVSGASSAVIVGDGTNACNFTVPNGFAFTGTVSNVNANATLTLNNATVPTMTSALTTCASTSTVVYGMTSAATIPGLTYGNVTFSAASGDKTFGGNANVVGTFNLSGANQVIMNSAATTKTFNIVNYTQSAGVLNTGSLDVSPSGPTSIMNITGIFNKTGGTTDNTSSTGLGQVNFNGGGAQSLTINAATANAWLYISTFVSNNTTVTLNSNYTITGVTGAGSILTIDAGSTLDAGAFLLSAAQASSGLTINGTLKTSNTAGFSGSATTTLVSTNSPSLTNGSASTIIYNSISAQTVSGRTDYRNVQITGNSVKTAGGTITGAGTLVVDGSAIFDIAATTTTFTGTKTIGVNSSNTGILRSAGSLAGAGAVTFNDGSKYQHNFTTSVGTIPTATWSDGSSCEVIGYTSASGTIGGTGQSFYDFTWNSPNQTANMSTAGALTTVRRNLTVTTTNTGSFRIAAGTSPTLTIGGNLQIDAGTFNLSTGAGTPSLDVAGNILLNGGTFQPMTSTGIPTISVKGNWTNNGGTFTPGSTTITFNNAGIPTDNAINGTAATQTFSGIALNKTGQTLNIGGSTNDVVVNGTLTLTAGTLAVSAHTLTLNGPAIAGTPNNLSTTSSSNLAFGGSSTGVSVPSSVIDLNTLTINNTNAAGVTLNGNITLGTGLTVNTSGVLDAGTNQLLGSGTATVNGTLKTANTNGLAGSGKTIDAATVTLGAASTVEYNAASAQSVDARSDYANLTLSAAGAKTFAGNSSVAGNFAVSGGAVTAPAIMSFIGGAAQNIAGLVYTDVAMSGAGTKTFTSDGSLSGAMTFESGTGTIDFDGTLNDKVFSLKSTSGATARIGNTFGTTLSGNVTVERYIPANTTRAWRLLAIPTTGSQTIKQAWQENQAAGAITPAGFGTQITANAASWSADGFDFQSPGNSMLTYVPAVGPGSYVSVSATSNPIASANGYMLFVRGDRTALPANATITPTVLRTTGGLKQGLVTSAAVPNGEYAMIGNPYASQIGLTQLTIGSDIPETFYVWDPLLLGNNNVGGFQTISRVGVTNNYNVTPNGTTNYPNGVETDMTIESGQAFFVLSAGSTNNTIAFNESSKTAGSRIVNIVGTTGEQLSTRLFRVNNGIAALADGTLNIYDNDYADAVDKNDGIKMANFNMNLGTIRAGKKLAIERKQVIGLTDTVYYNLTGAAQQSYRFEFEANALDHPNLFGKLVDSYLNQEIPINLNGTTTVDFTIDANAGSSAADRFKVVFFSAGPLPVTITSVKAAQNGSNILVEWKASNQYNMKQYEVEKSTDGINFSKVNTQAATGTNGSDVTYTWLDVNPVTGSNFYRIRSIGIGGDIKITQVVVVKIGKGNPAITIYPNPVVNRTFAVQFADMDKGLYQLRMFNTAGQLVFTKSINHNGGSATQSVPLETGIAKGNYHLEITKPDGSRITKSILITE